MNKLLSHEEIIDPVIITPEQLAQKHPFAHLQEELEELWLTMPLDLEKKLRKLIDRSKAPCHLEHMPGQRSIDKATLSVYITRTNLARLRKLAKKERKTITEVVNRLIFEAVSDIELTPEDYEQISKEQKEWLAGRDKRNKRNS